jgi:hypothetical protein
VVNFISLKLKGSQWNTQSNTKENRWLIFQKLKIIKI